MDEETRVRYDSLKAKNRQKLNKKMNEQNQLLQECINELIDNAVVLEDKATCAILLNFYEKFPFTEMGRIDWKIIEKKVEVSDYPDMIGISKNEIYHIIWGTPLPVIKCDLLRILDSIEHVTAVGFDTWLLSIDGLEVFELNNAGKIIYGRNT